MTPVELHSIIQSLTQGQKTVFRNWVRCNSKGTPLYLLLYDRLSEEGRFDEDAVRGTELLDTKKYYKSRRDLFDNLLFALSKPQGDSLDVLGRMETAIGLGAKDWVSQRLTKEMNAALKAENIRDLKKLVDFRDAVFQDYQVDLYDGDQLATIRKILSSLQEMTVLHEEVVGALDWPEEEKVRLAEKIEGQVATLKLTTKSEAYWREKLLYEVDLLNGDRLTAAKKQFELLEGILCEDLICSKAKRIHEISTGIQWALWRKDHERVSMLTFFLSRFEPETRMEEKERMKMLISRNIETGHAYLSAQFIEDGYENLLIHSNLFTERLHSWYLYLAGVTFYTLGDLKKGMDALRRLRRKPKRNWGRLTWQPEVLLVFFQYELEGLEYQDPVLMAAKRAIKKQSNRFPYLILDVLDGLSSTIDRVSKEFQIKRAQKELNSLTGNPNEARAMMYFDLETWLTAKLEGVPIREIYSRETGLNPASVKHYSAMG